MRPSCDLEIAEPRFARGADRAISSRGAFAVRPPHESGRDYRALLWTGGFVLAAFVGGPRTLTAGAWILWFDLARILKALG